MLPTDAQARKDIPIYSGFICYFPDAIVEVAKVSKRGNDQHNPGEELYWNRSKSADELDAAARHLVGTVDPLDGGEELEHAAALAWRAMANLQKLCEKFTASKRAIVREIENSKSQKIARALLTQKFVSSVSREEDGPSVIGTNLLQPYATRKDCTGDPACLTNGGRQAKWRDELVEESRRQVAAIRKQHEASAESVEGYIESLQSCGEEDCE